MPAIATLEPTRFQDAAAEDLALRFDSVLVLGLNDDGTMSVQLDDREWLPIYEIVEISEIGHYRQEGHNSWFATVDGLVDDANERAAEAAYERRYC